MKKYDSYSEQCDSIGEEVSQHMMRQITITNDSSMNENDSVPAEDNEDDSSYGTAGSSLSRRPTVTSKLFSI